MTDRPARTPIGYNGDPSQIRSGDEHQRDPFDTIAGIPPNMGNDVLPHVVTFRGLLRNVARTYYVSDEAVRDSWDNARFMRNDPSIMECLEQRQRSTALLGWHLEAEDEHDKWQKYLVDQLTSILRQIPYFLKYRENLLHALWYGKYAVGHRYRWKKVAGHWRVVLERWRPVNGDKLVFRYDDGTGEYNDDQVGIRVGAGYTAGSALAGRWNIERVRKVAPTDHGLAYFLEPFERPLLAIHKHMIEDGEYEAPERAGAIHGVGIRHRLYWLWYQKQETLAWLMEYLERSAFGIEIWSYPAGNPEAFEKTKTAAQERIGQGRNIVLVPRHPDSDILSSDVKRIEPGMAGADILDRIIREYFGHQMKRYILGQILTSEAAATGLGSGVANLHLDTYLQIIHYDAINLGETLTTDLLQPLQAYNWPELSELPIRFVIETETADVESKLSAWEKAYHMGLKLRATDVAEMIGASIAQPDEETLQDPQITQMRAQTEQTQQQMEMASQQQQMASQQPAQVQGWSPEQAITAATGPPRRALERYGRSVVGETKVVRGRTYRFNENSRWERVGSGADAAPNLHVRSSDLGVDWTKPDVWKDAFAILKKFQGKAYSNTHTGKTIRVSKAGLKEVVHHFPDTKPVKVAARLPEVIEHADYIGSAEPDENAGTNVRRFHYLGADLTLDGEPHYAILTVREDNNGEWFYDQRVDVLKNEGSPFGPGGTHGGQTDPAGEPSAEIIDPEEGEVKRNARERYRAVRENASSGNGKAGWKTVGGGSHVFIGDDGTVKAGCPGLKGEDLDDLGEDEQPENRRRREHRQDVAEHHGIEGHEVTAAGARKLDEHPHPETGKDGHGRQKAAPTTKRVTLAGREYEVKHDGGLWFYRLSEAAGWAQATSETAELIESQMDDIPFDVPELTQAQTEPETAHEKRAAKINPRTRVGRAILETAQDWGVPPDDLADALEYVWEQHTVAGVADRQRALEEAHKLTGLYQSDVRKLKNAGYDHTSAGRVGGVLGRKLAHFDEYAQELARQYPELGLGNPDDPTADFAGALWEILDNDRVSAPAMDDPGLLRQAAELVSNDQAQRSGREPAVTYEEFRKRGEVERYRKWRAERYAKKEGHHKTVAIDLDGTLATYEGWQGEDH